MATRGIILSGSYQELVDLARRAEDRGFDAAWVSETTQSATVQATVLAQVTERIGIGTNVALAFPRSPVITAMEAWDLDELTGGRFVVGLGSQVRRIIEERFSADFDQPAKRMAEYVEAMRTVWRMERGESATFEGELYRVLRPGVGGLGSRQDRTLPKVYVAAVGPRMTAAAARHADGILGHSFTSEAYLTDQVIPKIEQALAEEGRSRQEFTICQSVILCVSDDRDQAVREAKQQIAFYGATPNYRGVFASCGDEHLTEKLRHVFRDSGQNVDAMVAAVPDEAVERYAIAGTPDEVAERLADFERHVDHLILGGAWYRVPASRMIENLHAIIEVAGR